MRNAPTHDLAHLLVEDHQRSLRQQAERMRVGRRSRGGPRRLFVPWKHPTA